MSEGLSADFLGAKQPEHVHERLRKGQLGPLDIAAATMANIGPAMSFYFGFGYLAYTAGLASPLTIILAGVAILFLGNTLSEFSKVLPSTGGFISFIGKTFGGRVAVTTALMTGAGYIAAMASVVAIVGGFFQIILKNYNVSGLENVPWIIWTLVFLAFAVFMMIRGISISTRIAGIFFAFEMVILLVVSVVALFKFHSSITFRPFEPKNIHNGFSGLAAGFPLAVYLFIGWENSAALAEETDNPRKNIPKAVFLSTLIMLVSYVLFAFATVVGFKNNVANLSSAAIPFITVAKGVLGAALFFALLAGMTSTLGALIAGTNSQARLIFNAGREGLLPTFIGKVHDTRPFRVPRHGARHHRRVGTPAHHGLGRELRFDEPGDLLRGVLDLRHDSRDRGLRAQQSGVALLLQALPRGSVQLVPTRRATSHRLRPDRRAALLLGSPESSDPALQLVPVGRRRLHRPGVHLRLGPRQS